MNISLRELTQSFHVPKEWIILERTILLLMGLCTALDPTMNPMTVIRPYLERFVLGDEGDWSQLVVETTKELAMSLTALPGDLRKFMRSARAGELSMEFRGVDRSTRLLYRLGHQVIAAAIGIAGAAIAIVLEGRGENRSGRTGLVGGQGSGRLFAFVPVGRPRASSPQTLMRRTRGHKFRPAAAQKFPELLPRVGPVRHQQGCGQRGGKRGPAKVCRRCGTN